MRLAATIAAFTIATLLFSSARAADNQPRALVVLELFTSQGCSSCPAADRLFESYAKRTDLVALSFAVDYWDYLGWKDTLASPKFTKRQREYASRQRGGQVYTPQIIINGGDHLVGSDQPKIDAAIRKVAANPPVGASSVMSKIQGNTLVIDVGAGTPPDGQSAIIWVATVQPRVEIDVKHGENRGRKLAYFNVVRDLMPVGKWTGEPTAVRLDRASIMSQPNERCAVFLQSGKGGQILNAAWIE